MKKIRSIVSTIFRKKNRKKRFLVFGAIIILLSSIVLNTILEQKQAYADSLLSFNEGYGTTISDINGNMSGTITGATWKTEDLCYSGKCLFFDGSNWISFGDDTDLDFTASADFTIHFWLRHGPASVTEVIMQKYEASGADGGYRIQMESDGDISFGVDDANGNFVDDSISSTAATYDDNKWHFVSAVKDGTTGIYLYVDGVLVASDTAIGSTGTLVNDDTVYIGDSNGTNDGDEYIGFLDEVKIYTTSARSASEVSSDFAGTNPDRGTSASFSPDQSKISDGLVAYWKMDETSGNATDYSGNGVTLTNNSSTPFTASKYSNGAELDGSTDYFDAADNTSLSITSSVTLAAWIEPDDITGTENIIAKWDGSNESYRLTKENGNIRMYIDADANFQATTESPLSANTKIHVAGVYDASTATINLFINGQLYASSTTGTIPSSMGDDAGKLHIGAEDSSTSTANFFDGHIDEARIYNRALSPNEIVQLYNWIPGPIAYYAFDENTGTSIVNDKSGYNNALTIQNGSQTGWSSGKMGSAFKFDGTNDYMSRDYDSDFDFGTGSFTVNGWFKKPEIPPVTNDNGIINFGGFEGGNETMVDNGGGTDIYRYEMGSAGTTTSSIQSTTKRTGEYAYQTDDLAGSFDTEYAEIRRPDRSNLNTSVTWLTFYFRPEDQPTDGTDYAIASVEGSACYNYVTWNGGTWDLYIDNGATASSAVTLTPNQWNKIEFKIDGVNSTTSLSVNDGTPVTFACGSGTIDLVYLGKALYQGKAQYDDWVVSTSELNFNPQVVRMDVDGDGNSTDWDATNGYQEVDDIPKDNDTTYITSSTSGNKQLATLESSLAAGVVGNIKGIKTQALVRDESGISNLATVVRVNSTDYDQGEDIDPGATYNSIGKLLENNPATNSVWTAGTLDGIEIGILNNASVASRTTALSTMVLTDNTESTYTILSRYDNDQGYKVWMNADGYINFAIDDDSTWSPDDVAITTTAYDDNAWHHFSANKTSSGLYLYIDGSLVASDTSLTATGSLTSDSAVFTLGSNEPDNGYYWDGSLDEMRVYNYSLPINRIIQDMNGSHPAPGSPIGSALGWWGFDHGVGDTAYDKGSGGNNGNIGGATTCPSNNEDCPLWADNGKIGKAMYLNANDDYIDIGSPANLDNLSAISISAWIYPEGAGEFNFGTILFKSPNSNGWRFGIADANLGLEFTVEHSTTRLDVITADNSISLNTWQHVMVTWDGTSSTSAVHIYVNGVEVAKKTLTEPVGTRDDDSAEGITIGNNGLHTTTFEGYIDEVKLYNLALTFAQVKVEYNGGIANMGKLSTATSTNESSSAIQSYCTPGSSDTCTATPQEWKLDENDGQLLYSQKRASLITTYTGNLGNTTAADTDDPAWVPGVNGSGLYFDGSNDFANFGDINELDSASQFTISVWAKRGVASATGFYLAKYSSSTIRVGIEMLNDGLIYFVVRNGAASHGTTASNDTDWHHLVMVYDGTQSTNATRLKAYVDGVPQTLTFNNTIPATSGANTGNSGRLEMGRHALFSTFANGYGDQLRIYNYPLTQSQVMWDYNRGKPSVHYRFDECTGATANDASGNGNTGTITPGATGNTATGTCSSGTNTEMWNNGTDGKINASLEFDGLSDYVALADDLLDPYTQGSFCGWTKYTGSGVADTAYGIISFGNSVNTIQKANIYLLSNGDSTAKLGLMVRRDDTDDQFVARTVGSVQNGVWTHFCVVQDAVAPKIYLNGINKELTVTTTGTATQTDFFGTIASVADNVAIGRIEDISPGDYFDGQLDELQLFRYGLTAHQVQTLYNNGAVSFTE